MNKLTNKKKVSKKYQQFVLSPTSKGEKS